MSGLFDTIGQKAETLTSVSAPNGADGVEAVEEENQKIVEEIESLCMNCHENVSALLVRQPKARHSKANNT